MKASNAIFFLKYFLFLSFTLVQEKLVAQNLISNGSFEFFSQNDNPEDAWIVNPHPPIGWVSINTVDFYISGQRTFWSCQPKNNKAQDGNIYAGIICYSKEVPNYREYPLGLITKPLIISHKYLLSFYLQYSYTSRFLVNQFNVFFLNDKVKFPDNIRTNLSDTVQILTIPLNENYSDNWHLITDTVVAKGDEVEIGFGNLQAKDDDLQIQTLKGKHNPDCWHIYIFLDNVSLIPLNPEPVQELFDTKMASETNIYKIQFYFNDTLILQSYNDTLNLLIDTLKKTQLKVMLTGYADSLGSYQYNLALSKRRVNTIKNILITKGIASQRIETLYKSYLNPIASNESEEERSKNRRVEIELIQPNK